MNGTHFEYVSRIRRTQPQLTHDPESYGIGTVDQFYNLRCSDGQYRLFCSFFDREIQERSTDLYKVTRSIPASQEPIICHVDSIVRQIHMAPPIEIKNDEEEDHTVDEDTFVGIPMWEVR